LDETESNTHTKVSGPRVGPWRTRLLRRFNRQNPFGGGDMIRVLIVDDHEFFRGIVASILGEADGIVVVGECADGAEVLDKADATVPDVVLMDVTMPIVQGPDATRALLTSHPEIRVLMLSASLDARAVGESAQAGAAGFVFKDGNAAVLIGAIRTVAAGGTAWPEDHPSEPRP
jgi:DNA-binding NarL/FixJ family response regulator